MKRRRRLRRLIADDVLIRRRAAGESLRELAPDYDVAYTTLGRYFGRPEVKKQLKETQRQLRAERRQQTAGRAAEHRLERQVRLEATEQRVSEAEQARGHQVAFATWSSGRIRGSSEAAWRDERRAPPAPRMRADMHTTYDKEAERIVSAGGGTQALLDATELPTLAAAAESIDPALLVQAFDNDALERARPHRLVSTRGPRLRRLAADTQLLRRRAAGESLRSLAADYDVDHTTLARFFARAEIRELLRTTVHDLRADRRAEASFRSRGRTRRDGLVA